MLNVLCKIENSDDLHATLSLILGTQNFYDWHCLLPYRQGNITHNDVDPNGV